MAKKCLFVFVKNKHFALSHLVGEVDFVMILIMSDSTVLPKITTSSPHDYF